MFDYVVVSAKKTRKGYWKMQWCMAHGLSKTLYPMLLSSYKTDPVVGDEFIGLKWNPDGMEYLCNGRNYKMIDIEEIVEVIE